MADFQKRYSENANGPYYVDNSCIDCDACRETAPDFFKRNDDDGYSFVYKQPQTVQDQLQCNEAMNGCPVEAIGNDGDQ